MKGRGGGGGGEGGQSLTMGGRSLFIQLRAISKRNCKKFKNILRYSLPEAISKRALLSQQFDLSVVWKISTSYSVSVTIEW